MTGPLTGSLSASLSRKVEAACPNAAPVSRTTGLNGRTTNGRTTNGRTTHFKGAADVARTTRQISEYSPTPVDCVFNVLAGRCGNLPRSMGRKNLVSWFKDGLCLRINADRLPKTCGLFCAKAVEPRFYYRFIQAPKNFRPERRRQSPLSGK